MIRRYAEIILVVIFLSGCSSKPLKNDYENAPIPEEVLQKFQVQEVPEVPKVEALSKPNVVSTSKLKKRG